MSRLLILRKHCNKLDKNKNSLVERSCTNSGNIARDLTMNTDEYFGNSLLLTRGSRMAAATAALAIFEASAKIKVEPMHSDVSSGRSQGTQMRVQGGANVLRCEFNEMRFILFLHVNDLFKRVQKSREQT